MNHAAMGAKIKARRKELHLTQEQLAEKTGVSPAFIGHIERATRIASIETLFAICSALQVSADYLLGLSDDALITPILSDLTEDEWKAGIKLLHRLTGV